MELPSAYTTAASLAEALNRSDSKASLTPFGVIGGIVLLLIAPSTPAPFGVLVLIGAVALPFIARAITNRRMSVSIELPSVEPTSRLGVLHSALLKCQTEGRAHLHVHSAAPTNWTPGVPDEDVIQSPSAARLRVGAPKHVRSKNGVPLVSGSAELAFLPDAALLRSGGKCVALAYGGLDVHALETVLSATEPKRSGEDLVITWLHTRIEGGPDHRFKNNPRMVLARFSVLDFRDRVTGRRFSLYLSAFASAVEFGRAVQTLIGGEP